MLIELMRTLQQHHRSSSIDLAHALDSTPEAVEGMLERLVLKGKVKRLPAGTACGGGCNKCDITQVKLYEWVESHSSSNAASSEQ